MTDTGEIRNVDELFKEFGSRRANISYDPFVKTYGIKEGAVYDLDGYQLAFGQIVE